MKLEEKLLQFVPYNEQEELDRTQMLEWLSSEKDLYTRENGKAHFSSSAWVVNQDHTKVLMAYHNIYQSYSWLGGHNDGDEDFVHVAEKEVKEESGIEHLKLLSDEIYAIEILPVAGHVKRGKYVSSHLHLNLTYLFEADENDPLFVKADENSDVCWIPVNDLKEKVSEVWMYENIYTKLVEKEKKLYDETGNLR